MNIAYKVLLFGTVLSCISIVLLSRDLLQRVIRSQYDQNRHLQQFQSRPDTGGLTSNPSHHNVASHIVENPKERKEKEGLDPRLIHLLSKFPWIRRKLFMPNYFTKPVPVSSSKHQYNNSVITFLHHGKAAGSTTRNCLFKIAQMNGRQVGEVQSSRGRSRVISEIKKNSRYRFRFNTYSGGFSMGLCDDLNRPCSYFTVFRDPYERAISCYNYCKSHRISDHLCLALDARVVDVNTWAQHQGSFFFRQLLFDPTFCKRTNYEHFYDLSDIQHDFVHSDPPCWFKQKVIFDHMLTHDDIEVLVQYCIDHLEDWFAVIGLSDDYDMTLQLFQEVFKLQFHKECSGKKVNSSKYKTEDQAKSDVVNTYKQRLTNDTEVYNALYADLRLYEKIQEIYEKQKRTFFKLNHT